MKKCVLLLLVMVLLAGCGAQETFETLADVYAPAKPAQHRAVTLTLPEGTTATSLESENGEYYICGDFEFGIETMDAGDLSRTVSAVCGYSMEDVNVIQTQTEEFDRYDFVWCAVGEAGDQIGRAVILDDGNYHYVLTAMTDADSAGDLRQAWNEMFASFGLN